MKADPQTLLLRGAVDVIVKADLEQKLKSGKKLKIKFGIDPTGSKIHLGRAATCRHLKHFQDLGHEVQLVIGTFTGQIGDTSDKESERQSLSREQVEENIKTYLNQFSKVFDVKAATVFYNGDWFNKMTLPEFFKLQTIFSVNQMVERDNYQKRLKAGKRVGLHEFSYALLQGYDSVEMKSDVEIGATDQLFNMLAARPIQKAFNQEPQNVVTYDLLMGTDGRKMSTSWGNCIYIEDEPNDMYGKVMTVRDELMWDYFRLVTELPDDELNDIKEQIDSGNNLRQIKARLAAEIVTMYHSTEAAKQAAEAFDNQFKKGELPTDIQEIDLPEGEYDTADLLVKAGLSASKSEARRVIEQGGVKLNQKRHDDKSIVVSSGDILQVGKRRFAKIR